METNRILNYDEEITLTLPIRYFILLWHFTNANNDALDHFLKEYTGNYIHPKVLDDFAKDKDNHDVSNTWRSIDTTLGTHFGVEHFSDTITAFESIQLNDDLIAQIKDDHIKVDCQSIPFEKIEELAKAIKKIKKQKS